FENPYVAFRTTPNNEPIALSSLGSYGGYYTIGLDINNSGQIVGWSGIPQSNDLRPYILEPNQLLNPLPIAPPNSPYVTFGNVVSGHGSFYSINSFGTAVGNFNNNYAVAYSNGAFSFLNEKLIGGSGWGLVWATAINDSGHIVGVGFFNGATHGFLLTPYIDGVPPVLNVPSNISVAAESSFGTVISYPTSAIDDFFNPASISCNHSSGSLFPIGSTIVSCTATDGAGNTSAPRTFTVEVVDTAPNLSLPPYISTNASSASGATVTYFASADDAVSGQLPATCSPASGVTFPIGQTTVNCSASDGAGNTSTGSFNVYVLTGDQIFTPPDWYVTLQPNNGPTINMYVDSPGVTTIQPIDAATVGTTPAGFALSNGIAYQISTTAGVYFDYGVELIFAVPGPISETDFNNLRILHNNNGTLEDVTSGYGYDPATQSGNIHAYTYSFSPFYLAKKVDRKVSPLFNQTHAFKAGSTAPIKIQILNETGGNISSAATVLMARNLVRLGSNSASVVIDSGNSNPDLNFRYDNS
ncbi:MAG TPA: HYR domain-containing protein, partial [Sphingobacteriaceae bacterium]